MTTKVHIEINPRSGVPVYRQMMDQIRYYVAGQTLRPGDQLPSIREMASTLAVNPTTVVKAYTELEREGVIEMLHGKGAFISTHASALSIGQREGVLRQLARQLAVEASQLALPREEVIRMVHEELTVLQPATSGDEPQGESRQPIPFPSRVAHP